MGRTVKKNLVNLRIACPVGHTECAVLFIFLDKDNGDIIVHAFCNRCNDGFFATLPLAEILKMMDSVGVGGGNGKDGGTKQ